MEDVFGDMVFVFTPQLDHLTFFHETYRSNIFLYNVRKTKRQKLCKTLAHIYKFVRSLSRTMVIRHMPLVYLITFSKSNNDCILARGS